MVPGSSSSALTPSVAVRPAMIDGVVEASLRLPLMIALTTAWIEPEAIIIADASRAGVMPLRALVVGPNKNASLT